MEAIVDTTQEVRRMRDQVQSTGKHRNLKLNVLRGEDGRMLVIVSNRNAASAYPLRPGWMDRFAKDLENGLFG